jgi:hypothetical protein
MVEMVMSRRLPLFICLVFGLIMALQYFSPHPIARTINTTILDYWQIIFAMTLIVGIIGVLKHNAVALGKKDDVTYRLTLLAGLIAMPITAMIWGTKIGSPFMWLFENMQAPMQATVFALLAFYVASASLRGFRARSLPAAVLLGAAVLMLLSRSGVGDSFPLLSTIADWVRDVPSMSGRRAILMGIGLGSLTTSLRVILGIERTWLGGER